MLSNFTKNFPLFILLFFFILPLHAQIDTLFICNPGDPVQLNAPPGQFAYEWFPYEHLNNPEIANPIATPDSHRTYIVKMTAALIGPNLITNPDFNEGDTGFSSHYPNASTINTQGLYGINQSPANLNPVYFADCEDHTDGMGNMMIVDGSPIPNENVWCQTIPVISNTSYAFSTWLTSVNPNNPALLQFFINSNPIGDIFSATSNVCLWRQFYEIWDSGDTQEAEICIVNQNTNPNGNDFALDDFGFYKLEAAQYDTTVVIVEALEVAKERRVYFPNAFSPNQDGINDTFLPLFGKGVTRLLEFKIFNRWGDLVFERTDCTPNDPACAWDGAFHGKPLNPGIYIYVAHILFADRHIELSKGEIWLMR